MSSRSRHPLITGALTLTLAGIITRVIGFFYKIFLSHAIGAEGLGIYQLVFPVYAFCFALTTAGIQTAISRCCAAAFAHKEPQKARLYFWAGFLLSLALSLAAAGVVFTCAGDISRILLHEERCEPLLRLIAWGIPLGTVHICISAWYFSKNQTAVPSLSQLVEQLFRVFASFMFYQICLERGMEPTPLLAAAGILAGEFASALFAAICILWNDSGRIGGRQTRASLWGCGKELMLLSFPLTANRLLLTLLQSMESVLIPSRLQFSGLSTTQSLSLYGILTGMALPFILFPSAITNAVATMLLPAIAGEQARGNQEKIRRATESTVKYCLFLGIFASGVFFFFGKPLGWLVYGNEDAGTFVRILSFLCPFLYLTGTLSSILNGLGHTGLCFLQNAVGLGIRILSVLILIPSHGIIGYLWGMLISQLVITALNLFFVYRAAPFSFYPFQWLVLPAASLLLSCAAGRIVFQMILQLHVLPGVAALLCGIVLCGLTYLICLTASGLLQRA